MDDAEENTKRLPCNSPWETDNASTLSQRSQQNIGLYSNL